MELLILDPRLVPGLHPIGVFNLRFRSERKKKTRFLPTHSPRTTAFCFAMINTQPQPHAANCCLISGIYNIVLVINQRLGIYAYPIETIRQIAARSSHFSPNALIGRGDFVSANLLLHTTKLHIRWLSRY
jgi:hypothetical protein